MFEEDWLVLGFQQIDVGQVRWRSTLRIHHAVTVNGAQTSRSHGRYAKGVPADMGSEVLHLL